MIPQPEMRRIGHQLLERSKKGDVRWKQEHNTQFIWVGDWRIELDYWHGQSEPDSMALSIIPRGQNEAIGIIRSTEGDEDWDWLTQLHYEAERVITGWDTAVEKLTKALAAEGPIGEPAKPTKYTGPTHEAIAEDDIPF